MGRSPAAGPPEESGSQKEPGANPRPAVRGGTPAGVPEGMKSRGGPGGRRVLGREPRARTRGGRPRRGGAAAVPRKKTKSRRRNPGRGGEEKTTSTGLTGMESTAESRSPGNRGEVNRKGLWALEPPGASPRWWRDFPRVLEAPQEAERMGDFQPELAGKTGAFSTGIYKGSRSNVGSTN